MHVCFSLHCFLCFLFYFCSYGVSSEKEVLPQKNLNANSKPCENDCRPFLNPTGICYGSCFKVCPKVCKILFVDGGSLIPPLPQPPAPLLLHRTVHVVDNVNPMRTITTGWAIMFCISGSSLLFCVISIILRAYKTRQRNSRTRSAPIFFGTQEDFLNEDQGTEIDHPLWHINTIGLQQSVIDAIAVFKYKKNEGLIDGTDCSVCLTEFEEDESLRLLPKCSHAFHVSCIDTWLRSHQNCPLCRAPIVSNNLDAQVALSVPATSTLSSREVSQMENSENLSNQSGDQIYALPIEDETNSANSNSKMSFSQSILRNHWKVQSDLADNSRAMEAKMQPMKRSLSLDSIFLNAVASVVPGEHQGSSYSLTGQIKQANVARRGRSGSLMRSSSISIGQSLQKGPILMKRPFSSHSRSQDSILPLWA